MSEIHKKILLEGNAAIAEGNNEGFLVHCSDDTEWSFVGEKTLRGKQEVREYMATTYKEPPEATVDKLIAEGDDLIAMGDIIMKNEAGELTKYAYCDVWRFHEGKIVSLKAFVIKAGDSQ